MTTSRSGTRTDVVVFAILMGLLVLTYEAARQDLGNWNLPTAMAVASTKAALVAWFFMKLRGSASLTRLAAVAGLLCLGILFALTLGDYYMR